MFEDLHNNVIDYEFNFSKHIIYLDEIKDLESFAFLTSDSIKILNQIIDSNIDKIKSNERISYYIRGLGYYSNFVRNLCYNSDILDYLKKLTGIDLIPHYLFSNVGHINIGIPNEKEIDHWHYDSVPYVLIILLTNPDTFVGGVLEYEKNSEIFQVNFSDVGCAFFMKGSEIKHHVTQLYSGRRLTLINSYMDKNEIYDTTNLKTFEKDEYFQKEYLYKQKFFDILSNYA
jgi:hypothetical protein